MSLNNTITIESLITCDICKKQFDNPCSLACSHTYCRKCIETVASSNQQQFECPQRDACKILAADISSLPIHQALHDLIELHASIQRSNLCANCYSNVAEYACSPCGNKNYCSGCYQTVHALPVFQNHPRLPISEKLPELVPCKIHSKNQFEYWCEKCLSVLCTSCVLLKHKDHQYSSIEEVAGKFEIQVDHDLQTIQSSLKSRIDHAETLIKTIDTESESSRASVMEAIKFLRQTIDEHERAMLEHISNVEKEQKKQLEDYQTPLKIQLQNLDIQQITYQMLFTNKNLTKLLQKKSSFDEYVSKTNGILEATPLPTKTEYYLKDLDQLENLQRRILQCASYVQVVPSKNIQLEELIKQSQTKQELNLNSQRLNKTDLEIVANVLRDNTVTSLNLRESQIDWENVQYIADALKTNQTIVSLDLYHNQINKQGAEHIAEVLKTNQTLTTLRLGYNQIGDEGVRSLAQALAINHTLTSLDLVSNQIGILGAQYIAEALKTNKTLMSLDLFNNQIGEQGAQHIAEALKINQTLAALYLSSNQIGDRGAQHLADSVQTNETLTSIDLGDNQISDEGVQFIAEALKTNKKLVLLRLVTNRIGDQGAQLLADALKSNRTLTSLVLEHNRITEQGVQSIVGALEVNQTLASLDLRSNKIRHENNQWFNGISDVNSKLTVLWW